MATPTGGDARHVILGTGQVGAAVARVLGRRDDPGGISMVNRSGALDDATRALVDADVSVVAADLTDHDAAIDACRSADVVYLTAKPPYSDWPERFPPLLEGAIAGAAAADATLVFADNLYAYGPVEGSLTETLPHAATGAKGRTRAALAERLLTAHADGEVRATVGRASDFFGPGVTESMLGERVFGRILAGKSATFVGDPDQPHTYTYVDDFARALVTLGEREAALGEIWHVPSGPTMTTREFVNLIGTVAGTDAAVRTLPAPIFAVLSRIHPTLRELRETRYQFQKPFVVDHSKFEAAFGADPTPHEQAIEATLEWYRQRDS